MKKQRLSDAHRFNGFVPEHEVQGNQLDAGGRIVRLKRRQKKRHVPYVAQITGRITIAQPVSFVTYPAAIYGYILRSKYDELIVAGARQ